MKYITKTEIGHLQQQIKDHTGATTNKIFKNLIDELEELRLERKRLRSAIIDMARFSIEAKRIADSMLIVVSR